MSGLLTTLARTLILDDAAYRDWRDRPNLFLRGAILILVITLIGGVVGFGVNLVARVRPVDAEQIRQEMRDSFDQSLRFNPSWQQMDPEARQMVETTMTEVADLVIDISEIRSPLPRAVTGFFQALGSWLSRGLSALAGWMLYGALVLVAVNLLGGTAKLGDFLGMVALYSIPGLLALLNPLFNQVGVLSCLASLLGLVALVWIVVVYIKATAVVSGLDTGRAALAVFMPALAILVLATLLAIVLVLWLVIIF